MGETRALTDEEVAAACPLDSVAASVAASLGSSFDMPETETRRRRLSRIRSLSDAPKFAPLDEDRAMSPTQPDGSPGDGHRRRLARRSFGDYETMKSRSESPGPSLRRSFTVFTSV